jgi:hypothetical protein
MPIKEDDIPVAVKTRNSYKSCPMPMSWTVKIENENRIRKICPRKRKKIKDKRI